MSDDNTFAKPEDMRVEIKVSRSLEETIAKVTRDNFQYATAGDTKRLVEGLRAAHLRGLEEAREIAHTAACKWVRPEHASYSIGAFCARDAIDSRIRSLMEK